MRILLRLLPLLACLAALPAAAQSRDPGAIIAAFKTATGGAAWDGVDGLYRQDTRGGTTYITWVNLRRPAMRMESQGAGDRRVEGYNGRDIWWRGGRFTNDEDRGFGISRGGWDLFHATTNAFIAAQGYFFPDRFPFASRWIREERDGTTVLDVIELAPEGGHVLDYWFDRASGLLVRITAPENTRPMRVDLGDYRAVGPVRVAHATTSRSVRGNVLERGQLRRLEFRTIPARVFEPGAAP